MNETGRILAVNAVPHGDQLAGDTNAGAMSLTVTDAADFTEDGGWLLLNDEVIPYTAADDETGVITLGAPLAAYAYEGDFVGVYDADAGRVSEDVVAQVAVDGADFNDDALEAIVDHALIPYLPEGIREGLGEAVAMAYRGDDLYVVDVIGRTPYFDGGIIDPDTLPPAPGTFTWVKYADDSAGTNLSDDPTGKSYLGLAFNKDTPTESGDPADYQWSKITGPEGAQGVPGQPGADGQTTYTWIKYADDGAGGGITDDPTGKSYIGIAYNKLTATESANPADYQWSLFKGPQGLDGPKGDKGDKGDPGPKGDPGDPYTPPPVVTPLVEVTGMPRGFLLRVLNPEQGWSFVWRVTDTGTGTSSDYPATKNPMLYAESLPSGAPFSPTSEYTFRVTASNGTSAASSATTDAQALVLNDSSTIAELAVGKLVAGNLTGAFALLGSLQVGSSISINDEGGIVVSQPDGGQIVFPADGTAASISSHLDAFSLTVRDRLTIRGLLNEIAVGASVALASGVTAPTQPPTVTATWPSVGMGFAPYFEHTLYGLVRRSSTAWLSVASFFGGTIREARHDNGAAVTTWDIGSNLRPEGGLTMIGNTVYVLTQDTNRYSSGSQTYRWFVRRYDSANNMAYLGEWEYTNYADSPYRPVIGRDHGGTQIIVARCSSNGVPRIKAFNPTTGAEVASVSGSETLGTDLTSVRKGDTEHGHYVVTTRTGIYVFDASTGARNTTYEFARAAAAEIIGMHFDTIDNRWYSMDDKAVRRKYSSVTADAVRVVGYSWYDNDSNGTGTHETDRGPTRTHTQRRRQYFTVQTPPPNDTGDPDDPNAVRIWIDGYRQADLGTGVLIAQYEVPTTGTTSKAAAFPATGTSAQLRSAVSDGAGALLSLRGNGSGRWGGLSFDTAGKTTADPLATTGFVPVGAVSAYAGASAPAGWLICDGSAVDRTQYAALYAVIGTTYGAGNGWSTFNLPDLRRRFPWGADAGTGVPVGFNEGQASVGSRNPQHDHGSGSLETDKYSHNRATNTSTGGSGVRIWDGNGQHFHAVTGRTGMGGSASNEFPNLALHFIIRAV